MKPRRLAREIGDVWEQHAAKFLSSSGIRLIENNYSCRFGEIDLIGLDQDILVFIEIRYRSAGQFARAAESVDRNKKMRIVAASQFYLMTHPQVAQKTMRYDVIAIDGDRRGGSAIQWIQNAFDAA